MNSMKDFDKWNILKKEINNKYIINFFVLEREVWWGTLGLNIGFEMDGKNNFFERPMLIFKKYGGLTAFVFPITSKKPNDKNKKYFIEFIFNNKVNFISLTQGKTIDIRRLNRKIFTLDEFTFQKVKESYFKINNFEKNDKKRNPPFGGNLGGRSPDCF